MRTLGEKLRDFILVRSPSRARTGPAHPPTLTDLPIRAAGRPFVRDMGVEHFY